jgi:RimJ/RimL family protein N-acetyltransferase
MPSFNQSLNQKDRYMDEKLSGPAYRIHTPRLIVRCWEPVDAPLLNEAVESSIDHLKPFMPWAHEEPTPLQARIDRLRGWRAKFDQNQDFVYGIFDLNETRVIGGTGLHTRVGLMAREIGYWIRQDSVNQGFATEISMALVKVAFEIDQVHRIEIRCDPENMYSAAVPRKLGFTHEGTLRKNHVHRDEYHDAMVWSLLAQEYPTSLSAEIKIEAFDAIGRQIL